eukprot:6177432-Pleurochrysis_carterae.AAC.2
MKDETGHTHASKAPTFKTFTHAKTRTIGQYDAMTVHGGDVFHQLASSFDHEQSRPPLCAQSQSYSPSSPQRASYATRTNRGVRTPRLGLSQRVAALSARIVHALCDGMRKRLNFLFRHQADRTRRENLRDWTTKAGCNFGVACQDGRVLNFGQACAEGLVRFPHAPPPPTQPLKHAYTVHGGNFFKKKEVCT